MSDDMGAAALIYGDKIKNSTKAQLASDIAQALGLAEPPVSNGPSVDSTFLGRDFTAIVAHGRYEFAGSLQAWRSR